MMLAKFPRTFIGKSIGRRYQHGYIVLIPEIGEDSDNKDPVIKNDGLPEFNNITIENCRASIAKQSLEFESGIKNIEQKLDVKGNIFEDIFKPLELISGPLDVTWGVSKTLYLGNSSLMPTSSYLSIHERARQARASKYNNKAIYNVVNIALSETKTEYSSEEARILKKFSVEGRLNGLELNEHNKKILQEFLNYLTKEKSMFKYKIDVLTKRFSHVESDCASVEAFPMDVLEATSFNSNDPMKGPWKLTLQPHIYSAVMANCPNRDIRWNMWQAMVSRGTNQDDTELVTQANLQEIRSIRRDIANLLGFKTFADMSMQTKMVSSVDEVKKTLNGLLDDTRPFQDVEIKQLHEFAVNNGFQYDQLELWDLPYWRRQQQKSLFHYSEEDLKQYFPLNKVLKGLFQFCEKLFNIKIRERNNITVWHKDVKFFDVFEDHSSAPIAGFYFDPYTRHQQKMRMDKNSGWMVAMQNRSQIASRIPLSSLIFNFDAPVGDKPSCLTFKQVKCLFQKFGTNLQHVLTRTKYSETAGLSNVEWDAVEVSGHVMSHWLHNKNVINMITSHCETGESLPQDIYESLVQSDKHLAGVDLCHELYLSSLDLEFHSTTDYWLDITKKLWPQYSCFTLYKNDVHPLSFTKIFCEEFGAAYYCNVWSRLVAADVYSAFYEAQDDDEKVKEVAGRFRNLFLALGGSVHPGQVFREFRGRDPSPKALLRSLGLKK